MNLLTALLLVNLTINSKSSYSAGGSHRAET